VQEIAGLGDELVLYGTTACHLCEVAEGLLEQHCSHADQITYIKIDISESDELFHRYGIRIPVLRRADGVELDWPFSAQQLALYLQN
jgi:hypothetical protein